MNPLLDPSILFFVLGLLAARVGSNLAIPESISKFLALYLLMALGLKGGFALSQTGLSSTVLASLLMALLLASLIPIANYLLLKRWIQPFDAIAIAATYGSVSAVTFITATQFLDLNQIAYGGHMAAALAIMESPAIILAVLMATYLRQQHTLQATISGTAASNGGNLQAPAHGVKHILHEAFTDGAQLLLLGALVIGVITGEKGQTTMQPFFGSLFKGMLAIFLLDMGLKAARNFPPIKQIPLQLLAFALLAPITHAMVALGLARLAHLTIGDTVLLMVLAASASYIAVPAVLKESLPEANPALYFGLALGITFPLNIMLGIPFYTWLATHL